MHGKFRLWHKVAKILLDGGHLDKSYRQLCESYLQRLRGPWKSQIVELRKPGQVVNQISDNNNVIVLDERGQNLDSRELMELLQKRLDNLSIVVGGSYGHSQEWQGATRLALGRATMPHRLALLIVAEQLYRSYTLSIGHPYHHD